MTIPALTLQIIGLTLALLLCLQALSALRSFRQRTYAEKLLYQKRIDQFDQVAAIELARLRQRAETDALAWNGVRKFVVDDIVEECADVYSFYLKPHDNKKLPAFLPGQYLTFQLRLNGMASNTGPVVRCYSLSAGSSESLQDFNNRYRISVKAIAGGGGNAEGLVSNWMHRQLKPGDILDCKAPSGHFAYPLDQPSASVLIAGGIGITPLYAMLSDISRLDSVPETWLFYGVRSAADLALIKPLMALISVQENFHIRVYLSAEATDTRIDSVPEGSVYEGRIDLEALQQQLPSSNYQFYLCGPGSMMEQLRQQLHQWHVPDDSVHYEAFGAATIKSRLAENGEQSEPGKPVEVIFKRSNISLEWYPKDGSLLEFAEDNDVQINAGCRAGNCGTCATAFQGGDVEYASTPGAPHEDGVCLPCVAKPLSALTLDA